MNQSVGKRRQRIVLAGGEKAAYEKLIMALRMAEEAATEVGQHQTGAHSQLWMTLAAKLNTMHNRIATAWTARIH